MIYLEIEGERSFSLSQRHEEEQEEEAEADGGGDGGVLENVGVASSRGCGHIVSRAAQVFVAAKNYFVIKYYQISDLS